MRGFIRGLVVDVDDRNRAASSSQLRRDRPADVAASAGDERDRPHFLDFRRHDFRKSQPLSSSGRQAWLGGIVLINL
jgi:hypothetical protein